jgi:hypothetical protein
VQVIGGMMDRFLRSKDADAHGIGPLRKQRHGLTLCRTGTIRDRCDLLRESAWIRMPADAGLQAASPLVSPVASGLVDRFTVSSTAR